jgi:hypothetical protein
MIGAQLVSPALYSAPTTPFHLLVPLAALCWAFYQRHKRRSDLDKRLSSTPLAHLQQNQPDGLFLAGLELFAGEGLHTPARVPRIGSDSEMEN